MTHSARVYMSAEITFRVGQPINNSKFQKILLKNILKNI